MDRILDYFHRIHWDSLFTAALRIALILVLLWIVMGVVKAALQRLKNTLLRQRQESGALLSESSKRVETLVDLLRQGVSIALWIVAILIILREIGVEIAPILASAGILGLAVGFGAQNLVRDVISGFFLILENQVRVGDVATVNGTGGLVEQINFRTIVLRDEEGVVHIFPNGTITTLSNKTQVWSAYVFQIGVDYREDVDRVIAAIRTIGEELRRDPVFGPSLIQDAEVYGVEGLGDSAVLIKGRIKTLPSKQWDVGREFLRRVKSVFDKENISIPYPQRAINLSGLEKPLDVRVIQAAQPPDDSVKQ